MKRYFLQTHCKSLIEKFRSEYGEPLLTITHTPTNINKNIINYTDVVFGSFNERKYNFGPPLSGDTLTEYSDLQAVYLSVSNRINQHISYDEKLYQYHLHLRYWLQKIKKILPLDFAFFENVPHEGFDYLIYELLKREGVKVICGYRIPIVLGLIHKRYLFEDIFDQGKTFANWKDCRTITNLSDKIAPEFMDLLVNSEQNKPSKQLIRTPVRKIKRNYRELIIKYGFVNLIKRFLDKFYPVSETIIYFRYSSKFLVRNKYLEKYYKTLTTQNYPKKDYVFFPLHFEPELSTIPLGFPFRSQFQAVELLASVLQMKNIPIIIKEHPRAFENKRLFLRSKKIYDDLRKYTNVYFVDKDVPSKNIMDNSIAVSTVTGTAGWEAFLASKPVIVFGSVFYSSGPGVYRVFNISDIQNCLNEILRTDFEIKRNDKMLFLRELTKYSFDAQIGDSNYDFTPFSQEESDNNTLNALSHFIK